MKLPVLICSAYDDWMISLIPFEYDGYRKTGTACDERLLQSSNFM